MVLTQELISSNGISPVALGLFTAILTAIGGLFKFLYQEKREAREAKEASREAKEAAETAAKNTQNIGNGFAGSVLGSLNRIHEKIDQLDSTVRDHLEWHKVNEKGKSDDRKDSDSR